MNYSLQRVLFDDQLNLIYRDQIQSIEKFPPFFLFLIIIQWKINRGDEKLHRTPLLYESFEHVGTMENVNPTN